MMEFKGISVKEGKKKGVAYVFKHDQYPVRRYHIDDSAEEIERFEKSRNKVRTVIEQLFVKTAEKISEEDAQIFSIQLTMLDDENVLNSIYDAITDEMINAEVAIAQVFDRLSRCDEMLNDEQAAAMPYALRELSERLVRQLLGVQTSEFIAGDNVIIISKKLLPGEFISFDKKKVLGIALENDEINPVISLIASANKIPIVIGLHGITDNIETGMNLYIDGDKGTVTTE